MESAERLNDSYTRLSYRMIDYCSIFKEEVLTVSKAEQFQLCDQIFPKNFINYSDCQAIRTLINILSISALAFKQKIFFCWNSGSQLVYGNIVGKCIADELARVKTEIAYFDILQSIGLSVASIRLQKFSHGGNWNIRAELY